ncbi:MAG: hypothetical protein ACLPUG_13725 [Acidimicrobiales bacterium]
MRTVLRPLIAVAALVAFVLPSLASAASTTGTPVRHVAAEGGGFTWFVSVHDAKTCSWSSSPKIAGFDGTVKCSSGRILRQLTIPANPTSRARWYALSLTARGAHTTVDHLRVAEAGALITRTTLGLGYYISQEGLPLGAEVTTRNGVAVTYGTLKFTFVVNGSKKVYLLPDGGVLADESCIADLWDTGLALHVTPSNNMASGSCTGGGTVPLVRGRSLVVMAFVTYSGTPGYLPSVSPMLAIPSKAIVFPGSTEDASF